MKLFLLTVLTALLACCPLSAQEVDDNMLVPSDSTGSGSLYTPLALPFPGYSHAPLQRSIYAPGLPFDTDCWQLHSGFNASLTLSATVGWGKHSPSGVGLGEDVAFMYALPVNRRLSVAGGLYVSNFDWGGWQQREAGVAALAAYRLNPQFTAYVYGNKSFVSRIPRPAILSERGGDRIGAMIDWHPNETVSVQLSIEQREYPTHRNKR